MIRYDAATNTLIIDKPDCVTLIKIPNFLTNKQIDTLYTIKMGLVKKYKLRIGVRGLDHIIARLAKRKMITVSRHKCKNWDNILWRM